jgi:hypothetical protein
MDDICKLLCPEHSSIEDLAPENSDFGLIKENKYTCNRKLGSQVHSVDLCAKIMWDLCWQTKMVSAKQIPENVLSNYLKEGNLYKNLLLGCC